MKCILMVGAVLLGVAFAQKQQQYTTPVPILKQINRHNEDGSYSYGYEGADGSFKIETKYPDGEVYGKYGYVDDVGKVREVEYGASRRGFEPQGNDINVAPPTLRNPKDQYPEPLNPGEEDDGQYREDPSVYYKDEKFSTQPAYQQPAYQQPKYQKPAYQQPKYQQPAYQQPAYQPQYQQPTYQQPQTYQAPRTQPAFRPQAQSNFDDFDNFRSTLGFSQQPKAQPAPVPQPRPVYTPTNNYNQGYNNNYNNGYSNYNGYNNNYNSGYSTNIPHQPLPFNVDLNTGSYSVNYRR